MTDWKNPPRLFIPGPVKVNDDVLQERATAWRDRRDAQENLFH